MANDLTAGISQADIDAARTYNRAILLEQFPTYDLSIGGVVDSILVDGQSAVTARNTSDVNRAYLFQQLQQIAAGTVVVTDEQMDELMANYFLVRQQEVVATGSIVLVVRDNQNYSFQSGYTFRTGAQTYRLTATYSVFPVGTTDEDFAIPTNILIEQVYDEETGYNFRFVLPLSSVNATPQAVLVSGDRLTADQSFAGLGYVQATTNFQGGTALETNSQFATRGLQGLLAETLGGMDNIDKLVTQVIPLADSMAVGTGNVLMTRDRNNVFNLPTGGREDIYVKSGAIAQNGYEVDAVVDSAVGRTVTITLTREQSAGVYQPTIAALFTETPPEIISGELALQSIAHDVWTDPDGFNPEMPSPLDRAFSARQQIVLTVLDDRQDADGYVVTMGADGSTVTGAYVVNTTYQPGVLTLDTALTSEAVRPPGTDDLVKAAVPCTITLGVTARKPVTYNGPSASDLSKTLATLINELPVGLGTIDAYVIAGLLQSAEPTLALLAISINGSIYCQDDTTLAVPPVANQIIVPLYLAGKVGPDNTYFTTTSNLVTVALV